MSSPPVAGQARIWIGGLGERTKEDDLRRVFHEFGEIIDVKVRSNARDIFGFVEFETTAEAQKALKKMDQNSVDGRRIKCAWAEYKGPGWKPGDPSPRRRSRSPRYRRRRSPPPRYGRRRSPPRFGRRRSPSPRGYGRRPPSPRYYRRRSRSPRPQFRRRSPMMRRRSPSPRRRSFSPKRRSPMPKRSRSP